MKAVIKLPSNITAVTPNSNTVELDITPVFSMDVSRALDALIQAFIGEGHTEEEAIEIVVKIDKLIYAERIMMLLRNCITIS